MLVITGTQRSGTTCMAKLATASGYNLHGMEPDEAGGYENLTACTFYRSYLGDATFPFDDFPVPAYYTDPQIVDRHDETTTRFKHMYYSVIKFSFLLMNPAFVHIWHNFRPEGDKFLIMRRNFKHVCESKQRLWHRFQHDSHLLKQPPGMLECNVAESMAALYHYDYDTAILDFPRCIMDGDRSWAEVNMVLSVLEPSLRFTKGAWDETIDLSKVHFQ